MSFYIFQTMDRVRYPANEGDRALEATMMRYWTALADGDPNRDNAALPEWPVYDKTTDPYLDLAADTTVSEGVRTERCDFFDSL